MSDGDDETTISARVLIEPVVGAPVKRAYLTVVSGPRAGETFEIGGAGETVLGRDPGNRVVVIDDAVSRRHAAVRVVDGAAVLEDLGSRNGTFVNGERATRRKLAHGDKIQVGETTVFKFTYHDDVEEGLRRRMYESALRDGLTGAYNKRYLLDRLEGEVRFAARQRSPLSLLIFDLDHFKRVNDEHGHPAGDAVLTRFAAIVHATIRAEDVFARFGGEEFALLCRACAAPQAAALAGRLRAAVAAERFAFGREAVAVTVSVGVATTPAVGPATPASLVAAADEALYRAKRGGRDRVESATEAQVAAIVAVRASLAGIPAAPPPAAPADASREPTTRKISLKLAGVPRTPKRGAP